MKRQVLAVIPARLDSTRFPGKVLYEHKGQPLLWYVWREMSRSKRIDRVIIATDSSELGQIAEQFGADVFVSKRKHLTGSDRIAELAARVKPDIVLNIQADNLGLKAGVIDRALEQFLKERKFETATLARKITTDSDLFNPDIVKLVMDANQRALWFSRFPLPYLRGAKETNRHRQFAFWEHIGVYFYSRKALNQFAKLPRSAAEKAESLEQLRLLEYGLPMKVYPTRSRTVSIDSPNDLKKMIEIY